MRIFELAVVGGGIAGAASALRAAQYHLPTAWILGDRDTARKSRSRWVANVDNMIGVHPDLILDRLRKLWEERPDLLEALDQLPHVHIGTSDIVDNVHRRLESFGDLVHQVRAPATGASPMADGVFELRVEDPAQPAVHARSVILATGVMDRQPSIARQKGGHLLEGTHWIYPYANRETVLYCIRCEGHLTRDRMAAIIGASEGAAQVALMIAERFGSACCLLANGEDLAIESRTRRLLDHYRITIYPGRLVEVIGTDGGLHGFRLDDGTQVNVAFALVSLGLYRAYNELARALGAELVGDGAPEGQRRVRIDRKAETTVRGLFVVGDLAARTDETVMMQIYTAQEYAVRAVDTVDRRRRSRRRREILGEPSR